MKLPALNLLPISRRAQLATEREYSVIRRSAVLVTAVLIVSYGVLFAAELLLHSTLKKEQGTAAALRQATINRHGELLDQRIQEFNTSLARVQLLQKNYVRWSDVLLQIRKNLPKGITLLSLDLNEQTKTVTSSGTAVSRSDLSALRDSLATLPFLDDVTAPVSNLLQRDQIPFELTAKLKLP